MSPHVIAWEQDVFTWADPNLKLQVFELQISSIEASPQHQRG
jgi:hypothetical protein